MDKLKMQSVDITETNIDKIALLFPNVVTEVKDEDGKLHKAIDFEKLKLVLSAGKGDMGIVDDDSERYEFTWPGKKQAMVEAATPIRKTLRPSVEESKNWDTTENLYIEGDNLEALKLLQESYLGKVKMIYIDPPYNTGKDFIYKDNFTQSKDEYEEELGLYDEDENRLFQNNETNGRFHSDWCSMIYPRLQLARNLLTDDGVIFINIDENEITNLQKMCIDVFGEINDLGTIVWDKRNPKGDARGISCQHEYILVYAKNKNVFLLNNNVVRKKKNVESILKKADQIFKRISSSYSFKQANKDFNAWINAQSDFSGGEKAYSRFDDEGEVYRAVSMAWPNKKKAPDDYFVPLIHPEKKKPCPVPERGWRNPTSTMKELLSKDLILFGADESTQPQRKYLLSENMYENIPSLLYYGGSDTDMLTRLDIPFDTPKVLDICKEHIQSFTNKEAIILDFFSGSATTAHAVMQLNAEDGGNRKFIMVQLPEECDKESEAARAGYKNICEIGKERIRRAGEKIVEELKSKNEGLFSEETKLPDIGFRVLKLDSTNMKDVYYSAAEYSQSQLDLFESNIKEDRTDLDLLYGCLLDWGVYGGLQLPHKQEMINAHTVHFVNDTDLVACFDEHISEETIRTIAKRKPIRAVFKDASFKDSADKINVTEIFKSISPDTTVKVI